MPRASPSASAGASSRGNGPKYLNPGSNAVYDKSRVLYGLNWAKTDIVTSGEVVVCEGYTDVIGFHVAGLPRAVAPCGTALTEDHVKLLTRFAKRVVLAFDADAAGQGAAERSRCGRSATASTWPSPPCPPGSIRASWPRTTPPHCAPR